MEHRFTAVYFDDGSVRLAKRNSQTKIYRIPYGVLTPETCRFQIDNPFIVYILRARNPEGRDFLYVGKSKNGIFVRPRQHEGKFLPDECYILTQDYMDTFFNDGTTQYMEDQINQHVNATHAFENTTKVTTSGTITGADKEDCDDYLKEACDMLRVLGLDLYARIPDSGKKATNVPETTDPARPELDRQSLINYLRIPVPAGWRYMEQTKQTAWMAMHTADSAEDPANGVLRRTNPAGIGITLSELADSQHISLQMIEDEAAKLLKALGFEPVKVPDSSRPDRASDSQIIWKPKKDDPDLNTDPTTAAVRQFLQIPVPAGWYHMDQADRDGWLAGHTADSAEDSQNGILQRVNPIGIGVTIPELIYYTQDRQKISDPDLQKRYRDILTRLNFQMDHNQQEFCGVCAYLWKPKEAFPVPSADEAVILQYLQTWVPESWQTMGDDDRMDYLSHNIGQDNANAPAMRPLTEIGVTVRELLYWIHGREALGNKSLQAQYKRTLKAEGWESSTSGGRRQQRRTMGALGTLYFKKAN